jgi:hypothetical protein
MADTPFCVTGRDEEGGRVHMVSTPLYELELAPGGTIRSLRRKADGLQVVDPKRPWFNALCLQDDRGDLWQYYEGPLVDGGPHGLECDRIDDPYPLEPTLSRNGRRIIGTSIDNRQGPAADLVVRSVDADRLVLGVGGELVAYWPRFREFSQSGPRVLWNQDITFYADSPRVDVHLRTRHLAGRWYRLRVAFFTPIRKGRILHEIPFGRVDRPEGEFAAQNYVAVCDDARGLALFNRGLPGNNVTDGVVLLSLMRSVSISNRVGAESDMAFEEGEEHCFEYALLPFGGEPELQSLALARAGLEFTVRPYVCSASVGDEMAAPAGSVTLPATDSLMTVEPQGVVATAVFADGDHIIARLCETEGLGVEAVLRMGVPVREARECNAVLEPVGRLECDGHHVTTRLRPFEVKTVSLTTHLTPQDEPDQDQ